MAATAPQPPDFLGADTETWNVGIFGKDDGAAAFSGVGGFPLSGRCASIQPLSAGDIALRLGPSVTRVLPVRHAVSIRTNESPHAPSQLSRFSRMQFVAMAKCRYADARVVYRHIGAAEGDSSLDISQVRQR